MDLWRLVSTSFDGFRISTVTCASRECRSADDRRTRFYTSITDNVSQDEISSDNTAPVLRPLGNPISERVKYDFDYSSLFELCSVYAIIHVRRRSERIIINIKQKYR